MAADERPYVRSRGRVNVDGTGAEVSMATSGAQTTAQTTLTAIQAATEGATPAGANHIGQVNLPVTVITVTPTVLNADAYDANDTIFDATVITGAVRISGGSAILKSIVVADKDDQKAQLRLVFFDSTVSFGTANSAPSLSDADSLKCVGDVEILAAEYIDYGGVSVATKKAIELVCKASGSANLYVAAMSSSTPTYTTGGLQLRFGFQQS